LPVDISLQLISENFFALLIIEWVPYALSGAIVLCAILLWYRLKFVIGRGHKSLKIAIGEIEKTDDEEDFTRNYETTDERLSQDPNLGHAWKEFTETLILPEGDATRIRNTSRPANYFDYEILSRAGLNLRFYEAVPNYFVGAGLFFTFLGLVAALYFAGKGVASPDVAVAKGHLRELLEAATFKFLTSIAGLGASIAFSAMKKHRLHEVDLDFDKLSRVLEARLDFVTPAAIAIEHGNELRQQTTELQKFNTDLAFSIAEALDQRMSESFARIMEPLTHALGQLTSRVGQMNEDALERVVRQLTDTLDRGTGEHIERMINGLEAVQNSLGGLVGNIEHVSGHLTSALDETMSAFQDQTNEAAKGMRLVMEDAGSVMANQIRQGAQALQEGIGEASANLANAISPLAEQLKSFESTLSDLDQNLEVQRDSLNEMVTEIRVTSESLRATASDLRTAGAPLADTATALRETSDHFEAVSEQMGDTRLGLERLRESLDGSVDQFSTTWSQYQEQFGDLDGKLSRVFSELSTGLESYRSSVENFVTSVDAEMSKSVGLLSGAVQELSGVVEEFELARRPEAAE